MSENNDASRVETRGTGSFFKGLLMGGLTGIVVALLNAPQSGDETRAKISARTSELATQAKAELNHLQTQAVETANDVKHRAETQTKAAFVDLAERTNAVLQTASEQIQNFEKEIAQG